MSKQRAAASARAKQRHDRQPQPVATMLRVEPSEFFRCAACGSDAFTESLRWPDRCVRCAAKQKETDPCPSL